MKRSHLSRRRVISGAIGIGAVAALGGGGGSLATVACSRETAASPDRAKILSDLATLVIVPQFEEASVKAAALVTAVTAFSTDPTLTTLAAAQAAWRAARREWKITDGFLFGPADDLAVTGGTIDSGPPDVAKLEKLIAGTDPVDDAAVSALGGNIRGFAGLEALLFDPAKTPDAILAPFTAAGADRRKQLVAAEARELAKKIDTVRDAWLPGKGDYQTAFTSAGRGSKVFPTERNAIDEVVNAIAEASEILIALRLSKPLGLDVTPNAPKPDLVESRISDASIDDILAVLDGITMAYTCVRGDKRGLPLGDAVAEFRAPGDQTLRRQLGEARAKVTEIPPPLRVAVNEHRGAPLVAFEAVREVKRTIVTEVAGALGTTIGFAVTDGD